MDINYVVVPTFQKIHRDPNRFLFVMGPVGSGKSTGCIFQAFFNALRQKPDEHGVRHYKHLVIRATYPSLKSTTVKTWVSWFKDKLTMTYAPPFVGKIRYPLEDGTTVNMEIEFLACKDKNDIEKLRSYETSSVHINEASEVSEEVFQIAKTRINRFPAENDGGCTQPFIICDYNAVSTDHWLYKLAEVTRPEKGHSFYKQPPAVLKVGDEYIVNPEADNLSINNPFNAGVLPSYYEDMCMGNDPDFISVNVMNNYGEVRRGKPVYKDYDDAHHLASEPIKPLRGIPVIIGVDQGLTPSAVFTQQAPDGTVLVFDEITTSDCSLREFCMEHLWPRITTKYPWIFKDFKLVCDPATVQRSMNDAKAGTDILKECGFPVKLARTNVPMERREAVSYFLRMRNRFKLGPECHMLRKGFISEYKYDEVHGAGGNYHKDKPAKNEYSHPHDALQYAMLEYMHQVKRSRIGRDKLTAVPKHRIASSVGGY